MINNPSNFTIAKASNKRDIGLHLIFTSIITEKRRIIHTGTKEFIGRNRIDIFLSTLDSLRVLPIDSAEFYLTFDETTFFGEKIVKDFISILPFETKIINKRLEDYKEWEQASNSVQLTESRQVLLFANDDHCLIPSNLDEFLRIMQVHLEASNRFTDKQILVPLSHFPESHAFVPISRVISKLIKYKDDLLVPVVTPIGAVIINPKDFKSWFKFDFTKGTRFVGPENPFGPSVRISNGYHLIPKFELFRHFDAYSHIGLKGWPYQVMDTTIKLKQNEDAVFSKNEWTLTEKIKKPLGKISNTYLADSKIPGDKYGFAGSILKSNSIRLSIDTIRSINDVYKIRKMQQYGIFIYLVFNSKLFRNASLKYFTEIPTFFGIKLLFAFKKFRKYFFANNLLFAIFINGSSHGYFRYLRILFFDIINSRFKNKR
jgi:hypothetical protein